ncbi:MAG TPA: hypothetical protein VMH83_04215 [Candidatus Acidoferrum sp.]|nr:hypothetical protein [Candidatus Acidoferrum sp.]
MQSKACVLLLLSLALPAVAQTPIDRHAVVTRHDPVVHQLEPQAALTVGNGHFAFTADVTGLQSFGDYYYAHGFPLETKVSWAWHSRANPHGYTLHDADVPFSAYGRTVNFPTDQDSEAGQWLRQNPHDLPLARVGLLLDGQPLQTNQLSDIDQRLDLWRGRLDSHYALAGVPVKVTTVVHGERDLVAFTLDSPLLTAGRIAIGVDFPRGYDPAVKNMPDLDWSHDDEHATTLMTQTANSAEFARTIDDAHHRVVLRWQGKAKLQRNSRHHYQLLATGAGPLGVSIEFIHDGTANAQLLTFSKVAESAEHIWRDYWQSGAAIDFAGSSDPRANELERRVVLSQYLMGVQERSAEPAQETALTASSWYGKHHTEMMWWHSAHWILWGRSAEAERMLQWYVQHLPQAKALAAERGLNGARWAKMVGPDDDESPGGNALILWNQPQAIQLAELLYQAKPDRKILQRYGELVQATAEAMSSMLSWEADKQRYSLLPPIWISQEIYQPTQSVNPGFELALWRYGLQTAQAWRQRRGLPENAEWNRQLAALAPLPQKNGKYVAIESIPDTFDNAASRKDHPTMLAPLALLQDPTVDKPTMDATLQAVLQSWDFGPQSWGWDYPLLAMTALRLGRPAQAIDLLLQEAPNNHYLVNGHCPQQGAGLPVYLPANGALLTAVAMLATNWNPATAPGGWQLRVEAMSPLP